ncbi:MAG: hypothetical protein ACKVS6_04385 [Planctomycetota bacterium]
MASKTPDDSKKSATDSQIIERIARPGTAMRALLDEQKRLKKRRRRIQLSVILLILLVVSYFAITTFIFNPVEPSAPPFYDAVPSNCHFFIRKTKLANDFPLPATPITPHSEQAVLWRAFESGKLGIPAETVKSWMNEYDEFVKSIGNAPIDPLKDLLGQEICIAGRFAEKGGLAATKYCIYLRVSWKIRAAMGIARYEYFRKKFAPDYQITIMDGGIWKVAGAASKDIFIARKGDLLMISNDDAWIRDSEELLIDREGCFGLSSKFAEDIRMKLERRSEGRSNPSNIQLYADLDAYRKASGAAPKYPDIKSAEFGERTLASLYSHGFLKDVAGVLRFETTPRKRIALDATFRTDAEKLDAFGKKIFQDKWNHYLTSKDLRELAEMTPQAAFSGGAFGVSGGDVARQLEALLTIEDRRALDDTIRKTGKYDTTKALADDFGIAVGDRTIMVLRENNYPHDDKDPVGIGPDPAIALILPQRSPEKVRQIRDYFLNNKGHFGIQETYHWDLDGGYKLLEYYSPLVPGTGEIAVIPLGNDDKSNVIVSNQAKLIRNIHKIFAVASYADDRPYGESAFYKDLVDEQKGKKMNFVMFLNGPKFANALKKYVPYWAGLESMVDPTLQAEERPAFFAKQLKAKYPQFTPENVPEKERAEIEALVDEEMLQREQKAKASLSPQLVQKYEEVVRWVAAIPGGLASMELELKRVHLYLNVFLE